jgi:N utilization substance protein A
LSTRAQAYLSEKEEAFAAQRRELEIADDLAELEGLTPEMVVALAEKGIKTLDALGELAGYELSGSAAEEEGGEAEEGILQDFGVTESVANEIIVRARAHWFAEEDAAAAAEAAEAADAEGEDAETETKTTRED